MLSRNLQHTCVKRYLIKKQKRKKVVENFRKYCHFFHLNLSNYQKQKWKHSIKKQREKFQEVDGKKKWINTCNLSKTLQYFNH